MFTYFLSDIHMGLNSKENWYQQYVHQKMLKSVLLYIQEKGNQADDVVILGDWFDTWEYGKDGPMPSSDSKTAVQRIIGENSEIFTAQTDGDFITCLMSISGDLVYVNGNHDMTLKCRDLNDILQLSSKKICSPDDNQVYISDDQLIYAEHGHRYSLSCNNDDHSCNKIAPLPIGYFVSRTGASYCIDLLQKNGVRSSPELPFSGVPNMHDLWNSKENSNDTDEANGITFAGIYLTLLIYKLGGSSAGDYRFIMPDGTTMTGSEAIEMYSWIPLSSLTSMNFLEADIDNNLDIFAQTCSRQKYKLVVLGHTHVPKIITTNLGTAGIGLYANTGYLCADIPGMKDDSGKGRYMTFCEVERQPDKMIVNILKVDYTTGAITPFISKTVPV